MRRAACFCAQVVPSGGVDEVFDESVKEGESFLKRDWSCETWLGGDISDAGLGDDAAVGGGEGADFVDRDAAPAFWGRIRGGRAGGGQREVFVLGGRGGGGRAAVPAAAPTLAAPRTGGGGRWDVERPVVFIQCGLGAEAFSRASWCWGSGSDSGNATGRLLTLL